MTIPHTNAQHARLVTQFQTIMVDAALKRKKPTRFRYGAQPLLTTAGAIIPSGFAQPDGACARGNTVAPARDIGMPIVNRV
jgi:hypothetical protein